MATPFYANSARHFGGHSLTAMNTGTIGRVSESLRRFRFGALSSAAPLVFVSVIAAGCAGRAGDAETINAPNPEGCYIRVWDEPKYGGAVDYINGPSRYQNLRAMPRGRQWHNRIRSIQVGPSALATAYADTDFRGTSFPLQRDSRYPQLPDHMSGEIESLVVDCADPAA